MSGGSAPNAFKGFESGTERPACGGPWTSQPGNSSNPPATIPEYMGVIVASSIQNDGSVITGDVVKIIVVKTNPGYGPSPGHPGTGQVVATFCLANNQSARLSSHGQILSEGLLGYAFLPGIISNCPTERFWCLAGRP